MKKPARATVMGIDLAPNDAEDFTAVVGRTKVVVLGGMIQLDVTFSVHVESMEISYGRTAFEAIPQPMIESVKGQVDAHIRHVVGEYMKAWRDG